MSKCADLMDKIFGAYARIKRKVNIDNDSHLRSTDDLHRCALLDEEWQVHARAGRFRSTYFTVSANHPQTQTFLKTRNVVFLEKKRHLEEHPNVIHPLSLFSFHWTVVVMVAYFCSILLVPVRILEHFIEASCVWTVHRAAEILVDVINIFDIFLQHVTGLANESTLEIELNKKKITIGLLKNYRYYCEYLTCFPHFLLCELLWFTPEVWFTLSFCAFVKMLRARRVFSMYARIIPFYLKNSYLQVAMYWVAVVIWINASACLFATLPFFYHQRTGEEIPDESWIVKANLRWATVQEVYLNSLFWSTCAFFCIRKVDFELTLVDEIIVSNLCYILGYIGTAVLFAVLLQKLLTYQPQPLRLEAQTNQLKKYMSYRQLSVELQDKMVTYHKHKFHSIFFRENKMLSILSNQLRKEINMYRYASLVKGVNILNRISNATVQDIVTSMQLELYLPNDVIMKAGSEGDCMYFLSSGTVAIFTPMGREVCHLDDGSYFGEVELMRKDNKRITSAIALEICEVYRLDQKDFKRCFANEPATYKYMEKVALDRVTNTAFLEELHKKRILEKNMAVNIQM